MARTVVVEVRKAAVAGIQAALTAAGASYRGVSCSYGYSGDDDERRELIYTSSPRATHGPASLKAGRNFRDERMEFDIRLLVRSPGDAPEDNDTRAAAIGQLIEQWVADTKNGTLLGVSAVSGFVMSDLRIENMFGPTGSMSIWQYTVRYQARLT